MKNTYILLICMLSLGCFVGSCQADNKLGTFVTEKTDNTGCKEQATGNKAGTGSYVLVWEDDFTVDGAPCGKNWGYDIGIGDSGWGNNESQYYTNRADNVIIKDGVLKITAKKENYQGSEYTSARLLTKDKFEFTYGKVEFRAKLPIEKGTWPALWMLGANFGRVGWPACGEIDVMEHVGNNPNVVLNSIHTPSSSGATVNSSKKTISDVREYHIYSMEWDQTEIKFYIDNVLTYTYAPTTKDSNTWPFDSDQFIIMNVAMGGTLGGAIDSGFTETSMEIDYVKVYQK